MTGMPPKKDPLRGQKTLKVSNFLEEFEVDDIKRKVDIVELFESFGVKLSGKDGNYIGLCPFHEDHKPSLSVDRDQGLFNCFSGKCRAKGSVVDAVKNFKRHGFQRGFEVPQRMAGKLCKTHFFVCSRGKYRIGGKETIYRGRNNL